MWTHLYTTGIVAEDGSFLEYNFLTNSDDVAIGCHNKKDKVLLKWEKELEIMKLKEELERLEDNKRLEEMRRYYNEKCKD